MPVEVKIREVAPEIYQVYLPLPMRPSIVNVYLIRSGWEWALIDTGMQSAESMAAFTAALATVGCPPIAIRQLLATLNTQVQRWRLGDGRDHLSGDCVLPVHPPPLR